MQDGERRLFAHAEDRGPNYRAALLAATIIVGGPLALACSTAETPSDILPTFCKVGNAVIGSVFIALLTREVYEQVR